MSKRFGITIPEETADKLGEIAASEKVSRNEIIKRAINVYIKQRENPNWVFVPAATTN